jgi:excisionase family DNA binding protein
MAEEIQRVYRVSEVAALTSLSEITIRKWIKNGNLTAFKIGDTPRRIRIPEREVARILSGRRERAAAEPATAVR